MSNLQRVWDWLRYTISIDAVLRRSQREKQQPSQLKRFLLRRRNHDTKLLHQFVELRDVVIDVFVAVLRI